LPRSLPSFRVDAMSMSVREKTVQKERDEQHRRRIHNLETRMAVLDAFMKEALDPTPPEEKSDIPMPKMPAVIIDTRRANRKLEANS